MKIYVTAENKTTIDVHLGQNTYITAEKERQFEDTPTCKRHNVPESQVAVQN